MAGLTTVPPGWQPARWAHELATRARCMVDPSHAAAYMAAAREIAAGCGYDLDMARPAPVEVRHDPDLDATLDTIVTDAERRRCQRTGGNGTTSGT